MSLMDVINLTGQKKRHEVKKKKKTQKEIQTNVYRYLKKN